MLQIVKLSFSEAGLIWVLKVLPKVGQTQINDPFCCSCPQGATFDICKQVHGHRGLLRHFYGACSNSIAYPIPV